ncbi:MAG: hypothetical protein GC159_10920 [Phycisphaera sp.]|nr:hypothetical protein [Phycisphaera sp.]
MFDEPILKVGSLTMVTVDYERRSWRGPNPFGIVVRRYKANLSPLGEAVWTPRKGVWQYDASQRLADSSSGPGLPTREPLFTLTALDLDAICRRIAESEPSEEHHGWQAPTTHFAFPASTKLTPHPTPFVMAYARDKGLDWEAAWHALYASTRVPEDFARRRGLCLVDSRLWSLVESRATQPLLLGAYHDMRALLGRRLLNPTRHCQTGSSPVPVIASALRGHLRADRSAGCTHEDLCRAVANPQHPLIASGLARIQVWSREPITEIAPTLKLAGAH